MLEELTARLAAAESLSEEDVRLAVRELVEEHRSPVSKAVSLAAGWELAARAIDDGAARKKLDELAAK